MNSFWTTNKRKRLSREGSEIKGALQKLQKLCRKKSPMNTIVYIPLHFDRVGRSSVLMCWPACYTTTVHFQPQCLKCFGSKQREQAGTTGYHCTIWPPCQELLQPHASQYQGALSACPLPTSFQKLPGTHSQHRGYFYTKCLSVHNTRQRLYREG